MNWELCQSLSTELLSPNNDIYSYNEADKSACYSEASIASAYRLLARKLQNLTGNTKYLA
jgi:hypothetical protein